MNPRDPPQRAGGLRKALTARTVLVVFACVADGIAATLLATGGIALISQAAKGLPATADRGDFAAGMLLSGAGWGAVGLAVLFAIHACWCGWRLRKTGTKSPPVWGETVMILFAPVIAAATVIGGALRLLA